MPHSAATVDLPTFTYDADGQLVKVSRPKRVVYIDGIYEKDVTPGNSGEVTKYYFAEGRRVAMRKYTPPDTIGQVRYLAQDHLGSTAFVMNVGGALESHIRYYPYGMTWSQSATPATDRLFTGHQQMDAKSGTYYANARFYGADIGRFLRWAGRRARVRGPRAPRPHYSHIFRCKTPTNICRFS